MITDYQIKQNDIVLTQPKIAALYARVSTGKQENEATIDSQIDEIKRKIQEDNNVLADENIFFDDGYTGEIIQRPSLDLMRDAAIDGRFQVLYVYDRGRISRIFTHQEIVLEELRDKDIQFVSLHDINALTAEDRVLQAMQGVFAEYERIKIVERMRRGKMFKAKSGILINGSALYGYLYIKKTDTEPTHYVINEEEARVVRMIYQWVGVEGLSIYEVIKKLYDFKIPPRKRKSEFWTKGPITRILQCSTFTKGFVYYNKSEAVVAKNPIKKTLYKKIKRTSRKVRPKEEWLPFKVPTIIENNGIYEKVQKLLDTNKKYARKNRKYDYLLSGLVYCGCGYKRAGDGYMKGGNHYYRCAERIYKFPIEKKCQIPGVNAIVLDNQIWNELVKFINNPELLMKYANEWLKFQSVSNTNANEDKQRLSDLIKSVHEEEMRYAKAYGIGSLDFDQFTQLMKDLKGKKNSYIAQLKELDESKKEKVDEFELKDICDEARKMLKSLDLTNKYKTVRDIVEKIIIKERRLVEVWGYIPIYSLNMGYGTINRNRGFAQRWEVDVV